MTDWAAVALEAVNVHHAVQKPAELAALLVFLESFRPGVIIEIGSDAGGTLWAWSQLPGPPRVISVDLPTGGYAGSARPGNELPQAHGATLVTGNSQSRAVKNEVIRLLAGGRADMVFIDADHTYEGVRCDFRTWKDLVRPGGLVIFHDITPHDRPDVGVPRFWRELTSRWPCSGRTDIQTDPQYPMCGIGILCDQPLFGPAPVRAMTR